MLSKYLTKMKTMGNQMFAVVVNSLWQRRLKADPKKWSHFCLQVFVLGLSLFCLNAQADYSFPAVTGKPLPPGCSGSGGVYNCTSGLNNAGQPTTINNSTGRVIITVNGTTNFYEGVTIQSNAYPVTFYLNGAVDMACYTIGSETAAANTTFFVTGNLTMSCTTVHGSIYATGNNSIDMGIKIGINVTRPRVNGSVETFNGNINVYGNVSDCIRSANGSASANRITLFAGSSGTFGVNCASTGTTSCVDNQRGGAMPNQCKQPRLVANYQLDELSWTGATNDTADSAGFTGGPFNGQAIGSPLPTPKAYNDNPARAGNVGTCGYASFNGGAANGSAFQINNLPVNTATGAKTTVSFWMYYDGGAQRMPIAWGQSSNFNRYVLFVDNDPGRGRSVAFDTWMADRYGTSSIGLENSWHHVVAVFTNGSVLTNAIYIDGVKKTLSEFWNTNHSNTNAYVKPELTIGGFNDFRFKSYIDEVKIYDGEISQAQVTADFNATHTCAFASVNASAFNCVAVGGNQDTGRLLTQLTGAAFNLDVYALNASRQAETRFAAGGNKNVTVELVDASTGACPAYNALTPALSQTVTYSNADAGKKTISFTVNNAYRNLRCRVTDNNQTPRVIGCSSDNFAVRPTAFSSVSVTGANADSTGASTVNTPVLKAGSGVFTVQASTGMTGYNGTPLVDNTKISAHAGATRVGSVTGSFNAAVNGTATGNAFLYDEVGYFRFNQNAIYDDTFTAVDVAGGDCVAGFVASGGKNACGFGNTAATGFLGRFVPDRFVATKGSAPPNVTHTCGTFSYYGQNGLSEQFTLTARNTSNAITQNYTGGFAKLNLNTWGNLGITATNQPASVILSGTSAGTWSNGSSTVTLTPLLSRPNAPVTPATITLNTLPLDSDAVTALSATAISDPTEFRFGRLNFSNAYGSELLPLRFNVEAQYWTSNNTYQRNTADGCSNVAPQSFVMNNYTQNLAACETVISGGGTMVSGQRAMTLSKPGAGNSGSVNLSANLDGTTGVGINTCTSATQTSASAMNLPQFGAVDVTRRATFGVYKSPMIYLREAY